MNKMSSKKRSWIAIFICLAVFLASMLVARSYDTLNGTVSFQELYFSSMYGESMHGRLYIPANASRDNPAPGVIFCPGNDSNAEKHSMFAVEFARRGYVVLVTDIRGQGLSEATAGRLGSDDSLGGIEALEYFYSLGYVDKDNIVMGGHSLGAETLTHKAYLAHPDWLEGIFFIGTKVADYNNTIAFDAPNIDILQVTGRDDGDAYDLTDAAAFFGQCSVEEFETNKLYGSYEENNARLNYHSQTSVHSIECVDKGCVAAVIDFVQQSAPAPNPIDADDQIWQGRYIATTLMFISFMALILPVGNILLETPFFSGLCKPVPVYKGNKGKKWWLFAIPTIIIAPATYIWWTSSDSWLLPANPFTIRRATYTLQWALAIAAVTVVIFLLFYLFTKKENRVDAESLGLACTKGETMKYLGKTLLLSIILFLVPYTLLTLTYKWSHVEPRIWHSGFSILSWERVIYVLKYYIPFLVCYLVLGVNIHGTLRPKEGKLSVLKETLINIFMLAPFYYLWAIIYGPFAYLKTYHSLPAWTGSMYGFYFAVPIMMTIVATMSTYFFRKTGRIYLGACINAWLVCWTLLGGFSMVLGQGTKLPVMVGG